MENNLTLKVKKLAYSLGADLFGVASAKDVDAVVEQLRNIRKDEKQLIVEDKNTRMMPFDPVVTEEKRVFNNMSDYLNDAKSVIVLGMHYPETPAERVGKPPAESAGPRIQIQTCHRRKMYS